MYKVTCSVCGDLHICAPSERKVTTDVERVAEFLTAVEIPAERFPSTPFYEQYAAWCVAEGKMMLGRRTFNNTLVAMGWERRKIGGWYHWVTATSS